MTHRFFIPQEWLDPPSVRLGGNTARQIKTVLRLRPGDEIVVLDDSGLEWQVRLVQVGKDTIQGEIVEQRPARGEPRLHLTLYQGTLKAQKFEWVLQKGTELGVSRFVPVICRRSVVRDAAALAKKYARWRTIIREAAEQSGRGKLPLLEPALPLDKAIRQAGQARLLGLMLWESAGGPGLKLALDAEPAGPIGLFVGPEGGFTPEEAGLAQKNGCRVVTLGPRILRAETAGLAACAAIFYQAGEWE